MHRQKSSNDTHVSLPPVRMLTDLMRCLMRGDTAAARNILDKMAGQMDGLVALLQSNRLAGYFYVLIKDTPILSRFPSETVTALEDQYHRQAQSSQRNLRLIAAIRQRFDDAELPFLTLKGLYQSQRFFGDINHRFMWDLDILVHPGDLDAAIAEVQKVGLALRSAELVDVRKGLWGIHAVEMRGEAGKVDIHIALRNLPGMQFDYDTIWRNSHSFDVHGINLPTICDADTLLMATLGVATDIQRGAHNLRKIWDIYILLLQLDPLTDWDTFFSHREQEGSLKMILNVFSFVVQLLDVSADCPQLATSMSRRKSLLLITSEAQAVAVFERRRKHLANRILFSRLLPVLAVRYWAQWLLLTPLRFLYYRKGTDSFTSNNR